MPSKSKKKKRGGASSASASSKDDDAAKGLDRTQSYTLRLKCEGDCPAFPFKGHAFPLRVFLVDPDDTLKCNVDVPLEMSLVFDSTTGRAMSELEEVPNSDAMLKVVKGESRIDESGIADMMVAIDTLSMVHSNKKFRIRVKTKTGHLEDKSTGTKVPVSTLTTSPMFSVSSKIEVTNECPELWYKDQGGKEKCMDIAVRLVGPGGNVIKGRKLPLKLTLLYHDLGSVMNQGILKHQANSQREISASTGQAVLKIRIEDVSKNHQSKNFRVRVEPDTSKNPLYNDVAYDITTGVEIRSKVNKQRQRKNAAKLSKAASSRAVTADFVSPGGASRSAFVPKSFLPEDGKIPKGAAANGDTQSAIRLAAWCDTVKDVICNLNITLKSSVFSKLLESYETTVHDGLGVVLPSLKPKTSTKRGGRRGSSRPARESSTSLAIDSFVSAYMEEDLRGMSPMRSQSMTFTASSFNDVAGNVASSGMPSMYRNNSLAGAGLSGVNLFGGSFDAPVDDDVQYMLSTHYADGDGNDLGVPAFDSNGTAVGFYVKEDGADTSVFRRIDTIASALRADLEAQFLAQKRKRDSLIVSVDSAGDKYQQVEDVMIQVYITDPSTSNGMPAAKRRRK